MKKLLLLAVDGLGIGKPENNNAIFRTELPFLDFLAQNIYSSQISQKHIANADIHTILKQNYERIGYGSKTKSLKKRFTNFVEQENLKIYTPLKEHIRKNHSAVLHIFAPTEGKFLHATQKAIEQLATFYAKTQIFIHLVANQNQINKLEIKNTYYNLEKKHANVHIVSLIGSNYANNSTGFWEPTKVLYNFLFKTQNIQFKSFEQMLEENKQLGSYKKLLPQLLIKLHDQVPLVVESDVFLFFNLNDGNFEQLTRSVLENNFSGWQNAEKQNIAIFEMIQQNQFPNINVQSIIRKYPITDFVSSAISDAGHKVLKISPEDTFEYITKNNNQNLATPKNEDWILLPSTKTLTSTQYSKILEEHIRSKKYSFIFASVPFLINSIDESDIQDCIANLKVIDIFLKNIFEVSLEQNWEIVITSMCSGAENVSSKVYTNNVPLFINSKYQLQEKHAVTYRHLATTILQLLDIQIPLEFEETGLLHSD